MSRAVVHYGFGGPEVLDVREVAEPHAGPGEIRVKVAAVGLNPMDWLLAAVPELAARFGYTVPSGFGGDFAGTVDEVGDGVPGFAVGTRVYGNALGRAVADHVVLDPDAGILRRTPGGISDEVASTLPIAGSTAVAALDAIGVRPGDTVLVGGAAGGVGVFAVQLARLAGARVIGTAAAGTFPFLRGLGAEPVAYGGGLADRVRQLAPRGVTAATDLFGVEAAEAALALGAHPQRISVISAGAAAPPGVHVTGGGSARPDAMARIADAILAGALTVPVAARFPIEQIRDAVVLQSGRHVHGKVVVTL